MARGTIDRVVGVGIGVACRTTGEAEARKCLDAPHAGRCKQQRVHQHGVAVVRGHLPIQHTGIRQGRACLRSQSHTPTNTHTHTHSLSLLRSLATVHTVATWLQVLGAATPASIATTRATGSTRSSSELCTSDRNSDPAGGVDPGGDKTGESLTCQSREGPVGSLQTQNKGWLRADHRKCTSPSPARPFLHAHAQGWPLPAA